MRKETKIGIFTILTIALAIWGFNFLRGFDLLAPKTTLRAEYSSISGLRVSAPVLVNGLPVGLVADIGQVGSDLNRIFVVMEIDPDYKIPKSAVAEIVSPDIMGGTEIQLVFKGNCSGADCAQDGDVLVGVTKGTLASMATPEEVRQYVDELNRGLHSVLDTLNQRLAQSDEIQESVKDVRTILTNLKTTTSRLDRMMAGPMGRTLNNVDSLTASLNANRSRLDQILTNAEALTADLQNANVDEVAAELKTTMVKLQTTLDSSDSAIKELGTVLQNLGENGDGAIAMLLHDPEFAGKLQMTVKDLNLLLQDIRLHPERYRRILSKKKMPYEAPVDDPGKQ